MTRPLPSGAAGFSSLTSRYTDGHQRARPIGSARMSYTSCAVARKRQCVRNAYSGTACQPAISVLEVRWIEQLLPRPLDLLARAHDLDQLLAALWRSDHDRADQTAVLEEELAVELLLEAVCPDRLEVGLHVGRDAGHRQRRSEHRGRVRRHVEEILVSTGHVASRDLAVRLGVVPGAHLVVALDHEVVEDGDVARGVDVWRVGPQLGVGDHALVELDAGASCGLRVVVEPDAISK